MLSAKILLIEDDPDLGETIADNLNLEGHQVDWIRDGAQGLLAAEKRLHNLILLDVMLPHKNGFEILKRIRELSQTPVLMLTARGAVEDRIQGLELKADDYLTKPFHLKELLLRIQNLLRRSHTFDSPVAEIQSFKIGASLIDFAGHRVILSDQTSEILSEKELRFLRLLVSRVNQVVSRDEILNSVWGFDHPSTRTIDNFIVKFRKWFEENPTLPTRILSHRGVGYSLQLQAKESL
jgi:two-component system alkaline phosphatase synthesis response regulator PhoP